jgi:hypothetical protein
MFSKIPAFSLSVTQIAGCCKVCDNAGVEQSTQKIAMNVFVILMGMISKFIALFI